MGEGKSWGSLENFLKYFSSCGRSREREKYKVIGKIFFPSPLYCMFWNSKRKFFSNFLKKVWKVCVSCANKHRGSTLAEKTSLHLFPVGWAIFQRAIWKIISPLDGWAVKKWVEIIKSSGIWTDNQMLSSDYQFIFRSGEVYLGSQLSR